LNFIFTEYFLVGLVIGVICLILILIGLNNDKYKFHFYVGVVFTILNIIYQLRDIWSVIPFWLYLLIGGLVLIFVATQKQMKKIEKK
jgi:multisubunit Na+/H+ antiporter MnhB subunit